MDKLTAFVQEHIGDDLTRLVLDRKKWPDIDMDLAVSCIQSRRKLKGKVQEWYMNPELIFPVWLSAEQCSSTATGIYKSGLASIIAGSMPFRLADLTGGLGVDSWYFSQKASQVWYHEMQEKLCIAAEHNFRSLNAENIVIRNMTSTPETIGKILCEAQPDIVYMDPARRGEGGKKVFLLEECTPDVLTLKEQMFKHCRHILLKLSPMADITMACSRLGTTCREVHIVATGGECKELLIWMDREWSGEYTITAVELPSGYPDMDPSAFSFLTSEEKISPFILSSQAESRDLFLFEPGKSLMKAGCFNLIANRFGLDKLGISTHYYVTGSPEKADELKPYGKVYMILDVNPLDKRSIKAAGAEYPRAEVTARNIPMDTETLRKKLGVTSGDDAHIFGLKSDSLGNLLIITQRY
jgi:hypothetical protein